MTSMRSVLSSVGWWALIVAVLVVALVGFLSITRGTVVRHVQGVGVDGNPVAPAESHFPLSAAMLTGTRLHLTCASSAWRVARNATHYSVPGSVYTNGSRR
jgi:hypothetical protein